MEEGRFLPVDLFPTNQTVLVVEDEIDVLENIVELLEAEGFTTISAHNGEEAFRLISEQVPNLIISDVRMPQLDGKGLLARIAESTTIPNIPFIFVTALTDRNDLRSGMELGADDYIMKPFTRRDLLGAVRRRLLKHHSIQKEAARVAVDEKNNLAQAIPFEMLQPLAKIQAMADQLKLMRTAPDGERVYQAAQSINISADSLIRSVMNYITVNNFDLGPDSGYPLAKADTTVFRIEPVVNELTQTLFWEYGRQDDLHLEIEDEAVSFQEPILVKIFEEIIRNALANTTNGQSLRVCGTAQHDHGSFSLAVCGPKLFLRDEQIEWLTKPGGRQLSEYMRVGIGLILAKKLTEASGSRLFVKSLEGEQVCMGFPLPLAR